MVEVPPEIEASLITTRLNKDMTEVIVASYSFTGSGKISGHC